MPMTFEDRAAFVEELAASAAANPRRYRIRVVAWILLGYAIITTLLAIAVLLSAGVTWAIIATRTAALAQLAWIPAVFAFGILRALFVRLDPPVGREIERREAPRLFDTLDEIGRHTGVTRLHRVLLVQEMNAAVVELPRFGGLFGWQRQLLIGMPLLLTHSTEETKAILAHELGHLSGRHGRVAGWSWRVRVTWSHLLASLGTRRGPVAGLLRGIVTWYFGRLEPITLVQARAHERAADAVAAELTSAATAARALTWVAVTEDLLAHRFWRPLWARVEEEPQPPAAALEELWQRRAEILAPPWDESLEKELARTTALDSTHPALRERLHHLGIAQPDLALPATYAADELFEVSLDGLVAELDREWREAVRETWNQRHAEVVAARIALEETESASDDASLIRRAEQLTTLGRDADAFPIYAAIAARDPENGAAAFHVGRILIERGDLAGLDHLRRATEDWRFAVTACEIAHGALRDRGLEKEADLWAERHQEHYGRRQVAAEEAMTLSATDEIVATGLSEERQQWILDRCREARWIGKVWIARKNLKSLPHAVNFVAVKARSFTRIGKRWEALVQELSGPDELMIFLIDNPVMTAVLDRMPGARRSLK